ncbi:hypothetical protein MLD38_015683 [Melastoma candidum]|uniref:Uncharacterized protein n=1 Tax=Melastoma candidum TaxID=119954 RepID=A0ACB9RGK0_9MYRT|nr:hypothetical protein MLD38_015683 [Melastoma candidum]
MDNIMGECERNHLIDVLTQGRELAEQLQVHFHHPSPEVQQLLLLKILLSYDKALSMLTCKDASPEPTTARVRGGLRPFRDSEPSPSPLPGESPASRDSEPGYKEYAGTNGNQALVDVLDCRKAMPRWTNRVRVTHGTAIEGQLDDGHSWRKYGQKDILHAKYPRGYYRCTNRGSQGCLATKQVQQSDEDPTVFEITYRGRHTCSHASVGINPSSSLPENENPNDVLVVEAPPEQQQHQQADLEQQKDHDKLLDFYNSLASITECSSKNPLAAFSLPSISDDLHQLYPLFDTFNFSEAVTRCELIHENQHFHSREDSELDLFFSAGSSVATSSGTNSRAADARDSLDYILDPAEFNNSSGNPWFFSK